MMQLWIPFAFGGLVCGVLGFLIGRYRAIRRPPVTVSRPSPSLASPPPRPAQSGEVKRVALDEGSANVLNVLNNRLAAIGALADLLHGAPLDPDRAHALLMLHQEVRRAAEITQHFLELADHPIGAAEPSDAALVLNTLLAARETTFRQLGVKLERSIPRDLPMVACPMAQLTDMLTRLLDFALGRLRDSQPPRELRIGVTDTGPSLTIALSDSGAPLSVEAEQRLVSPFRFTQGGGGDMEFAMARALAQSSGGTLRLRRRTGGGAEVVVTLPKGVLLALAPTTATTPSLPKLRILVVEDDAMNRQAMRRLLEREGHDVVAVENGLEAVERLAPAGNGFDAIVTDLQMPRLGGRALWEQLSDEHPQLARRFVFVTGDVARDETRHFLEECGQPCVLKPYELSELIAAIGKVTSRSR
jgi:CheY-like chemotaxis protein